ncbi:universal stress protein [Paracoccus sp. MC1854]|uniref:universal stress protein n=1 Tax=Paracoccus sp. MC1854 TaxID=2760306 RepID=UPI001602E44F|nr:universal stress protein [Paracoccus sp. MC1854]MBB1492601.1 universal stress protein [Paracoccus sp. MC1854]
MNRVRTAYMPLNSYPEGASAEAVQAAAGLAAPLGAGLHVTTFPVKIPPLNSPLGSLMLNVPEMARTAEERSRAECQRLAGVVQQIAASGGAEVKERPAAPGEVLDAAADEARYFDLSLLPWSGESMALQDLAQAVIFGSGRPAVVVPPAARVERVDHIAVAWDGSRAAARALGDALALTPQGCRITVLTVEGEKKLERQGLAAALASSLERRGFAAQAREVTLGRKAIGGALQDEALQAGASLLVMGGFGHSRLRDFILGGATQGIFVDLRVPVLMSH